MHSPEVAGALISGYAWPSSQLVHCMFDVPSQVVHALAHAVHITNGKVAEL